MNRWQIGDVKITCLIESEQPMDGTWLLPNATPDTVRKETWLLPQYVDEGGNIRLSIHAYLLESKGKRIVVDTCIGNNKKRANPAWSNLHGPFLKDLAAAGCPPDTIDYIVCTHMHLDHVGWNTMLQDGKWIATFPKARYLLGRTEWDYWSHYEDGDLRDSVDDSVRPIVGSGLAEMVDPDRRITEELWLEPTPGHTPGHVSVRISSRAQEGLILGDVMHHPIQCAYPEWNSSFDYDKGLALKTRRSFLERYADRDVAVFGTHFATPSCGKIVSKGNSFRFLALK